MNQKSYYKIFIAISILVLIVVVGNTSLKSTAANLFLALARPVTSSFFYFGQKIFSGAPLIFHFREFLRENELLREENRRLTQDKAELAKLKQENVSLRQALKIGEEKKRETIIARVIGFDRQVRDDVLLIDKGSRDGVKSGDLLLTGENHLAGRIRDVLDDYSRAVLSSSASEVYNAVITQQNIAVLAKGNNNGELLIDFVPDNAPIAIGDLITSSGRGDLFLDGVIIGKVVSASRFDNQIFQKVAARVFFDPLELIEVIVVKR